MNVVSGNNDGNVGADKLSKLKAKKAVLQAMSPKPVLPQTTVETVQTTYYPEVQNPNFNQSFTSINSIQGSENYVPLNGFTPESTQAMVQTISQTTTTTVNPQTALNNEDLESLENQGILPQNNYYDYSPDQSQNSIQDPNYFNNSYNYPADYQNPSDQTLLVDNQYVQPMEAAQNVKKKQNPLKNLPLAKILTAITACLLLISLLGFFFTLLPKFSKKVKNVEQKNLISAFNTCKNNGGEVSALGVAEICKKDGMVYSANYTKEEYDQTLKAVERTAAENGQIIYYSSDAKDLQRFVVGSYYKTNAVPKGVVAYISSKPELTASQIINNLFLQKEEGGQKDNDVFVNYVNKFLDRDAQYTGAEPLGEESAVLRAFDVNEQRTKSRTIGEIGNVSSKKLEAIRAVYGVDGAEQDKRAVTVRVFGRVRDNVILMQNNISKDVQVSLENNILAGCRSQFKFKTDIQNCYAEKLKSDQTLANEAGRVAAEMINQFNLQ